jgi:hypothetical protein
MFPHIALITCRTGGARHSGIGREGPRYPIEEMPELKQICWQA